MATSVLPALHEMTPPVPASERLTVVVFSGEMDRLLAAFTLATGAAACGTEVTMFFTFWATAFLKTRPARSQKSFVERCFGWLLPGGPGRARLSRLDMGGIGRYLMTREMRRKGMPSLQELLEVARESGIKFAVCESSMSLIGISREELPDDLQFDMCGVAHLWDRASGGQTIFV
jgi:peroxiredoxin family protein